MPHPKTMRDALTTDLDLYQAGAKVIARRLAEDDAGAPAVDHDQVVKWARSWGTADERPRPMGRKHP